MSSRQPSKSARKREFLALQTLGERLIDLQEDQLDKLGIDGDLRDAVTAAQSMRAHGALRRQKQLIGKLMRNVDPEPIRRALGEFGRHDKQATALFHAAEKWRDRIAAEGLPALAEFLAHTGEENRSLQALVDTYATTSGEKPRRLMRRRMFAEIHRELALKMQSTPS